MIEIWSSISQEILLSKKKKYIFGTTRSSFTVFLMSLNENVFIEAFVTDNGELLGQAFNKDIIFIENVPENSIILVPDDLLSSVDTVSLRYDIEIKKVYTHRLAEPLREKGVLIWGIGNNGAKTFKLLTENNVKVKGFIDSDLQQEGKVVNGLPVYFPERVDSNEIIVISSMFYKQILNISDNKRFTNVFIDYGTICVSDYPYMILRNQEGADIVWNLYWHFFVIMRDMMDKNIIIYGYNELGFEVKRIFHLMNKKVKHYIEDEVVEDTGDIVKDKFDILYENADDNMILVCKFRENAKKELVCDALPQLENMGLKYGVHFKEIRIMTDNAIRESRMGKYGCKLDPLLGYTITYPETSESCNQYVVLGDSKNSDLKIMILGGSTSDIGLYQPEKSWPEFLWEQLGKRVVIYGGGIGGYNSRQECLKLLRDIGSIKPDIVISYSGVNDIGPMCVEGHPFIHDYQLTAMRNIDSSFPVDEGFTSKEDRGTLWLRMEESMCAIAQACGCKFYGILQPAFYNKKTLVKREKLINMYGNNCFNKVRSNEILMERYEEIKCTFVKSAGKNKSLYNLSDFSQ